MRPLERLLPDDAGFTMPEVSLQNAMDLTNIYGANDAGDIISGLISGKKSYNVGYSRQMYLPNYATNSELGNWQHGITINGSGFFNHIYGYSKNADFKVTIDGVESIILTSNKWNMRNAVWGSWQRSNNNSYAEGMYYYAGFNETTLEYLHNFLRGSVKFEQQLKIEYRPENTYTWIDVGVDYIMESEISWE